MSLDPELPIDPPESQAAESLVLDSTAAQVTDPHAKAKGHHGPIHTHCENCGAKLQGSWCHACGQHDFEFHRSFLHVVMEALEAFFHFDSNFFRSTFALLFKPGWLTDRFNAGKRAAQMPPFRLYLFVAFVFFLVMHYVDNDSAPHGEAGEGSGSPVSISVGGIGPNSESEIDRTIWAELTHGMSPEDWRDPAKVDAVLEQVQVKAAVADARIAAATPEGGALSAEQVKQIVLDVLAEESAPSGALVQTGENGEVPAWLSTSVARVSDPEQRRHMFERFVGSIPKMLLVCMPVFALLTRFLFRRNRDFVYLKHLVLALHFHSFLYLWTLVLLAVGYLVALPGWGLEAWTGLAGAMWVVVYVPLMLRRLFGNSWVKTMVKSLLLAAAYGSVLVLGLAAVGAMVFIL